MHPLDQLEPRDKPPATVRAIDTWIQQAESQAGIGARRLGWMVASGVVIAALQRVLFKDDLPRFLIKGGTYLELRLGLRTRATRDLDALFRGTFDEFLDALDEALAEPFDGITFRRTEPEKIQVPGRSIKPRRFDVVLQIRGRTWRRISLEVSPDEGRAGVGVDVFRPPSLAHFGLKTPMTTAGLVMDYQVAQKLHACTDPHTPEHPNDRVRDVVDLLLIKSACYTDPTPPPSLGEACRDVFSNRAREAALTGEVTPRAWPPVVIAHPHWQPDFRGHADELGLLVTLDHAVSQLNDWIALDRPQSTK